MENRKGEMVSRTRLIGLDLFRIISMAIILMFHSSIHYGCYYGVLDEFVKAGAVMMTGFFMLSGYSLWYVYGGKDFFNTNKIRRFWLKRIISIFPGYYVGGIIYIIFIGKENLAQNILLMPMELLGLQSLYPNTFNLTHNGGTWFVSCILICYMIFPFLTWILEQLSPKGRLLSIGVCAGILLYSPILVNGIPIGSIYSNPFLRLLEFAIGMELASLQGEFQRNRIMKTLFLKKGMIVVEAIFAIVAVTFCMKRGIGCGDYMLYSWIVLPVFILMFPALGNFVGGGKFLQSPICVIYRMRFS